MCQSSEMYRLHDEQGLECNIYESCMLTLIFIVLNHTNMLIMLMLMANLFTHIPQLYLLVAFKHVQSEF